MKNVLHCWPVQWFFSNAMTFLIYDVEIENFTAEKFKTNTCFILKDGKAM